MLIVGGRILLELQNGGIVNTGIESRPELIEHLSKMEREWQKPITFDCPDEELSVPVIVYLGLGSVNVACIETVPYLYEGLSVELRPINAIPTGIEWERHNRAL